MSDSADVLKRFHRALVEEIQTHRPEYLTSPFTVAEIYQNLVPYSSHRDRIGIEMNGDYEDALLRLLAGEGGYLTLESEPALRDLRAELETANPNTGLYREYAAVDVRINRVDVDLSAMAENDAPDLVEELSSEEPKAIADLAPAEDVAELIEVVASDADTLEEESAVEAVPTVPGSCQWCRAELPIRDNLNFCPYCGTDLKLFPCNECGEELEPDWRFCIACGTEVVG